MVDINDAGFLPYAKVFERTLGDYTLLAKLAKQGWRWRIAGDDGSWSDIAYDTQQEAFDQGEAAILDQS